MLTRSCVKSKASVLSSAFERQEVLCSKILQSPTEYSEKLLLSNKQTKYIDENQLDKPEVSHSIFFKSHNKLANNFLTENK